MKTNIAALLFILTLALCSCSEKADRNTVMFSNYLSEEFKAHIPDSLHYYILLPKIACKGCSVNTLNEMERLITPENQHCFTFISTNEHVIPKDLKIARFFQYDTHGRLDDLDMEIANVTVIKTQASRVIFIKPIYADEKRSLSEIITFLKKE